MTVSNALYLQGFHDTSKAAGSKEINSDFAFEIEGYESLWILTKSCPWPVLSPSGDIELPGPMGSLSLIPAQVKTALEGEIEFFETTAGSIDNALISLIASGGTFNAKIYKGDPERYIEYKIIRDCYVVIDSPPARDWENRTQPLLINGSLKFHYFGETVPGNITAF